jgi:hypothetical protein
MLKRLLFRASGVALLRPIQIDWRLALRVYAVAMPVSAVITVLALDVIGVFRVSHCVFIRGAVLSWETDSCIENRGRLVLPDYVVEPTARFLATDW